MSAESGREMFFDWRHWAACRPEDDRFLYANGKSDRAQALRALGKAICAGCPVRLECLDTALDQEENFGIWGGMTAEERQDISDESLRRKLQQPLAPDADRPPAG